jgi:hypothetical protein
MVLFAVSARQGSLHHSEAAAISAMAKHWKHM